MKVKYSITVNQIQIDMLLKAIEWFKATNPDISINVDYKGLERQIEPLNRHMERVCKNVRV